MKPAVAAAALLSVGAVLGPDALYRMPPGKHSSRRYIVQRMEYRFSREQLALADIQ
jgi:hypothetical protein